MSTGTVTITAERWVIEAAVHALATAARREESEHDRNVAFRAGCDLNQKYLAVRWPQQTQTTWPEITEAEFLGRADA